MPGLRRVYQVHGHTDVPSEFVIPTGDGRWPKLSWGWSLGYTVTSIRLSGAYPTQVAASEEELKKLKFCFTTIAKREWNEKILPSLKVYRQLKHHGLVERPFVVPSEPPWPEMAWGMPLGVVVNAVRTGSRFFKQSTRDKDALIQLGFSWDFYQSNWRERIFPAIQVCASEIGHFYLPCNFVVPARDPWPKSAGSRRATL
ncbi:unnamed protein product [Phytophthora lilii]|uniref:Unnamed protein product n=1 Tax=Phytophthora lilii TaxID=2077276 RepID=A0A9W6YK82_9STRA|nr:unnamed protein product [Phytophthora lilii]